MPLLYVLRHGNGSNLHSFACLKHQGQEGQISKNQQSYQGAAQPRTARPLPHRERRYLPKCADVEYRSWAAPSRR